LADSIECARVLLDLGARLEAPSRGSLFHPHAIGIAAKFASPELAELLLSRGANANSPNTKDNKFWSPAHLAAAEGKADTLRVLLAHGADPNASAADAMTPLHLACEAGRIECARMLIQSGSRVDALAEDQRQPSYFAICPGMFADKHHSPAILAELLSAGADPDWIWHNPKGSFLQRDRSLAMLASGSNAIACLNELERFGADLGAKNSLGHDAHLVAKQRSQADASAWFDARSQRKALELHLAAAPEPPSRQRRL
jgi:ankyrin repeat protein